MNPLLEEIERINTDIGLKSIYVSRHPWDTIAKAEINRMSERKRQLEQAAAGISEEEL